MTDRTRLLRRPTLAAVPPPAAAGPRRWYRMELDDDDDQATVYLYGAIGGWWGGVDASEFVRELAALDVATIDLYVNSPGGDVFDGVAMLNALRRHKARVVAHVDGLAASAASYVIQGADEVIMGRNSELMIHDAWGFVMGNAQDMRAEADVLDRLSANIADVYAEAAGGTAADWRAAMLAETWYSADEAVDAGLADRVDRPADADDDDAEDEPAAAAAKWDLGAFAYRGRTAAPTPAMPAAAGSRAGTRRPRTLSLEAGSPLTAVAALAATNKPPAEPAESNNRNQKEDPVVDLKQGLRERLGVKADADLDDDGLLAAIDEALAERATEPETPTPAPSAAVPEGAVMLDQKVYDDLRSAADDGRAARQEQLAAARVATVDTAISEGRIRPADRKSWLDALTEQPDRMATVLASFAKGSAFPVDAKGYTGGVDEAPDDDDRIYGNIYSRSADEKKETV